MSMGKGQWRLRVSGDFSSSHQLRHYEGKCENMHGHNFEVEVDVVGDRLDPKLGILMDFKVLKRLLRTVTDELDHRHLNELPAFADHNPSSELLAQYVYRRMKELLAAHPVRLEQVMVSEKASSRAYYSEGTD
jgi:6-pyruvoyltetrahydropterin/6-carboxytetrahydropterin synthase